MLGDLDSAGANLSDPLLKGMNFPQFSDDHFSRHAPASSSLCALPFLCITLRLHLYIRPFTTIWGLFPRDGGPFTPCEAPRSEVSGVDCAGSGIL